MKSINKEIRFCLWKGEMYEENNFWIYAGSSFARSDHCTLSSWANRRIRLGLIRFRFDRALFRVGRVLGGWCGHEKPQKSKNESPEKAGEGKGVLDMNKKKWLCIAMGLLLASMVQAAPSFVSDDVEVDGKLLTSLFGPYKDSITWSHDNPFWDVGDYEDTLECGGILDVDLHVARFWGHRGPDDD